MTEKTTMVRRGVGETFPIGLPGAWSDLVAECAPACEYGPDYVRGVLARLLEADRRYRNGWGLLDVALEVAGAVTLARRDRWATFADVDALALELVALAEGE